MVTTLKLTIAGISFGGVAVGLGFGIHHLTKTPDIEKNASPTQTPKKKTVLDWMGSKKIISNDTEKGSVWTNKWETFKVEHKTKSPDGDWKIEGWDTKKDNGEGLTAFKGLCEKNSQKETDREDAKLVIEVIKYCVE